MIVKLNDRPHEAEEGCTLANFIDRLGIQRDGIAVAIDYEVVPRSRWGETILTDNVELILIHAVSGG